MNTPPFDNSETHDLDHLPDDLKAVDALVSEALRDEYRTSQTSELADRIFESTVSDIRPQVLSFERPSSQARLRLAASLFLAAGIGAAMWFASGTSRDSLSPTAGSEIALDSMSTELGPSNFEEVMLVSVLEGDGSWIDEDGVMYESHVDAESVLRTRGTSVDDLTNEMNSILGMTF